MDPDGDRSIAHTGVVFGEVENRGAAVAAQLRAVHKLTHVAAGALACLVASRGALLRVAIGAADGTDRVAVFAWVGIRISDEGSRSFARIIISATCANAKQTSIAN